MPNNIKKSIKSLVWNQIDVSSGTWVDFNKWRIKSRYSTTSGSTTFYYCKGRERFKCQAQLRVDRGLNGSLEGLSYCFSHSSECSEGCNNLSSQQSSVFINNTIKEEISKLLLAKIHRPKEIQRLVSNQVGFKVDIKKIYAIKSRLKEKTNPASEELSVDDFESFCKSYRFKSDSEPFILSYTTKPIRIFMTTLDSLRNLAIAENLHVDATYKLTLYGFPVIVLGFSDKRKSFHCCGLILTENEDAESYSWIFDQVTSFLSSNQIQYKPKNIIADNAQQITQLATACGPSTLRTNCWYHVSRLIDKLVQSIKDKEIRSSIIREIKFLQVLTSQTLFEMGKMLFRNKYTQFSSTRPFINDFFDRFVQANSNWYESYDIFNPSTNNSLENFNNIIKKKGYLFFHIQNYKCYSRINIFSKIKRSFPKLEKFHQN